MNINKIKYSSPYSCFINLTSKCNLRCRHCFGDYSKPLENELTLEEWKKVVDDLIKSKVFFINVSGGEPTQSPYFRDFIRYLSKRGMHFILTTNGVFSEEVRDFILENKKYLIGLKISLDGPDAESHGFVRLDSSGKYNSNLFKVTLKNILFFKKQKISLTIASVLHRENIKKFKKFQRLIKKINPISWFISPIIPLGRGDANRFIAQCYEYFNNEFWERISAKSREKRINVRLIDVPKNEKQGLSAYECAGAVSLCEINSDGTVSPCTLARICMPIKFDNIKVKSIKQIWNGKAFNEFRSYMDKGCKGCKMLSKCNKCIAQSFKYFNNGCSPTPYCVKNGKLLGLKDNEKYKGILKNKFNLNIK